MTDPETQPGDSPEPAGAASASGNGRDGASRRRGYWRGNLILIVSLLSIWAFVSLGCSVLWIEWLNHYRIGKLPLGFWFAQQGSMYVFVVLIFIYAFAMDRLDRKYGVQQ